MERAPITFDVKEGKETLRIGAAQHAAGRVLLAWGLAFVAVSRNGAPVLDINAVLVGLAS